MSNLKNELGLKYDPIEVTKLCSAQRIADRCIKLHIVFVGLNGMFWVVCFADANKLLKMGYEVAN